MKAVIIPLVLGLAVLAGGWWYVMQREEITAQGPRPEVAQEDQQTTSANTNTSTAVHQSASGGDDNLVDFSCVGGKKITAVFTRDIVGLTLSDGRQMELRQEISGSGIRYLSNDGSVEFRGKGNEGFLVEDGVETYSSCISH